MAAAMQPLIGSGQIRHERVAPVSHQFVYDGWFLLLPMRAWRAGQCAGPARNRWAAVSFADRDHGQGGPDALAWFEQQLSEANIPAADDDEIWLQTFPRLLGWAFKPVSFWYVHRADGSLRAVGAEVNNTFGERHLYLLDQPDTAWGHELSATKVFHVSPFCRAEGRYRFRFLRTPDDSPQAARIIARVELDDAAGQPLLATSISGALQPLDRASLRRQFLRHPGFALSVIARIHWHALRLWWKGVPFHRKPDTPPSMVSR
jgi:DUF1365 family protein